MLLWKEDIPFSSFGGQPIFLLTMSNAFVKSIKAIHSGLLCSRDLSCNCRTENIMSIVDLPVLKTHCDSGIVRSARICSIVKATQAKTFPRKLSREMPRQVLQSLRSPLFFVQGYYISISHVLMNCSLLPAEEK